MTGKRQKTNEELFAELAALLEEADSRYDGIEPLPPPSPETCEDAFEDERLDLSLKIQRAMRDLDVSQAELARRMGVSRQSVSVALAMRGNTKLRTLSAIAFHLGLRWRHELVEPSVIWPERATEDIAAEEAAAARTSTRRRPARRRSPAVVSEETPDYGMKAAGKPARKAAKKAGRKKT